jgi:D-beta-D-heptose 7-phosphate kinase/D-beta-D-heptose 1-phosphate adenosyltransferase
MLELIGLMEKRVGIVGDLMLDEYAWGQVSRISPEAPVPVVEWKSESFVLGGAGNVATNVKCLGGYPLPFGVVGRDDAAQRIIEIMGKTTRTDYVLSDYTRPTTVKKRIVAHNQQLLRLDRESRAPISSLLTTELLAGFRHEISSLDVVVASDYNKGLLTRQFFDEIAQICLSNHVPLILDPKAFQLRNIGPITVITPNEREAEQFSGIAIRDDQSAENAGRALLSSTGAKNILITRGEHGMTLISDHASPLHLPTEAKQVFDVSGAGDTVAATLALALAAEAGMAEAAQLANLAAGIVVGKVGTASVDRDELTVALQGRWSAPQKNVLKAIGTAQ